MFNTCRRHYVNAESQALYLGQRITRLASFTSLGVLVNATALESTAKRSGWLVVLTELVYAVGVRSKLFSTELDAVLPRLLRRVAMASTAVAKVMLAPEEVVKPVGVDASCKQTRNLFQRGAVRSKRQAAKSPKHLTSYS